MQRSLWHYCPLGLVLLILLTSCVQSSRPNDPDLETTNEFPIISEAEAYARLSDELKEAVDRGKLVWSGYEYLLVSPLVLPEVASRSSGIDTLQTGVLDWQCPLEKGERPNDVEDHGIFYLRSTRPGAAGNPKDANNGPINQVSASFILPPSEQIKMPLAPGEEFVSQEPFVMIGGWGAQGGAAFDTGLAWQDTGWYFFTNRSSATGAPDDMKYPSYPYRLRPKNGDVNAPLEVDIVVTVDRNDHFNVTVTAKDNTEWVNPYTNEKLGGQSLSFGGSEENSPLPENDTRRDDHPTWPVQSLKGLRADGVGNTFNLQVTSDRADRQNRTPLKGTKVPDIKIYNLEAGDKDAGLQPWDVTSGTGVDGFDRDCPGPQGGGGGRDDEERAGRNGNAFNFIEDGSGGNTAATDAADAFTIDIDVKEENVHSDLDGDGTSNEEEGANDEGGPRDENGNGIPDYLDNTIGSANYSLKGKCYIPFGRFGPCEEDEDAVTFNVESTAEGDVATLFWAADGAARSSAIELQAVPQGCEANVKIWNNRSEPIYMEIDLVGFDGGSFSPSTVETDDPHQQLVQPGEAAIYNMFIASEDIPKYGSDDPGRMGAFDRATQTLMDEVPIEFADSCYGFSTDDALPIALDSEVQGIVGSTPVAYSFSADGDTEFTLTLSGGGDASIEAAIYRPNNDWSSEEINISRYTKVSTSRKYKGSSNTHTFVVTSSSSGENPFTLSLAKIDPPKTLELDITKGLTITDRFEVLGDSQEYVLTSSLTGKRYDPVYQVAFLDAAVSTPNSVIPVVNLPAPGNIGSLNSFDSTVKVQADQGIIVTSIKGREEEPFKGDYTITLEPTTYNTVFIGDIIEQNLREGKSKSHHDVYTFEGVKGQLISPAAVTSGGTSDLEIWNSQKRLVKPIRDIENKDGPLTLETQAAAAQFIGHVGGDIYVLPETDTYTISLRNNGNSYLLGLPEVSAPQTISLKSEPLVLSGNFSRPGEYKYYKFEGSEGQIVEFGLHHPSGDLKAILNVIRKGAKGAYNTHFYDPASARTIGYSTTHTSTSAKVRTNTTGAITLPEDDTYYIYVYAGWMERSDLVNEPEDYKYDGEYSGEFEITITPR